MKKISKAEVAFSGLDDALLRSLKEWRPPSLKTELEYRNHLFDYLRQAPPEDARLEKEYRHSRTTSDLYLHYKGMIGSAEVFFELKHNLKKKAQFTRLVGQIEELDPERHTIFVVLTGESDPSLVARLKERYERPLHGMVGGIGKTMEIVEIH